MTDEQFNIIVSPLKNIKSELSSIESNTGDISYVDSNTVKTVKILDEIKDNLG